MSCVGRFDRWAFPCVPARRLAQLRILVAAFASVYVAVRAPAFLALRRRDVGDFEPVGIAHLLRGPLPDPVWVAVVASTFVAGVLATLGIAWRMTGPALGLGFLTMATYRSSWGQVLHFEQLLVLHLLVLACARAADASTWPRRRATPPAARCYGWPLRLSAWITVATYVVAGVAKLRIGGWSWMAGDALRHHVAYSAVRLRLLGEQPSPLAPMLVGQRWTSTPLAAVTLLLELGAPVALVGRRLALGWIAAVWVMHAAIAATMFVVFPYPLLGVAFAPLLLVQTDRVPREVASEPGG